MDMASAERLGRREHRYAIDVTKVMDLTQFDYDASVKAFPNDQVQVKGTLIFAHSQEDKLQILRFLGRQVSHDLRIFAEGSSFYIQEPLGKPVLQVRR